MTENVIFHFDLTEKFTKELEQCDATILSQKFREINLTLNWFDEKKIACSAVQKKKQKSTVISRVLTKTKMVHEINL